jgi:hypothetical protein
VILYEICDYDEFRRYHSNKAEAIKEAKDYYEDHLYDFEAQPEIYIHKIDLGKIDKAKVINLLEGHSYAEHQILVKVVKMPKNYLEEWGGNL